MMKSVQRCSVSSRVSLLWGLGLVLACDRYRPPVGTAGAGGSTDVATAGSGGAGGDDAGSAGVGGASGQAGTTQTITGGTGGTPAEPPPPEDCPDDGSDTAELTLAGLGLAPVLDAGVPDLDAGVLDAGASLDAGPGDVASPDGGALSVVLPGLVGWASVSGLGTSTTLGGARGRVVTARTASELQTYAASAEPLVIRVCGTIRAPSVQVSSNKTLVGVGTQATIEGGLRIRGTGDVVVRDVIVKNLRVNGAYSAVDGAAIQVYGAHHVWLDHDELWDSVDGLIQVVHGADLVTVSWTKFHFTEDTPDNQHRFACLIGHSDDDEARAEDEDHLRVTLHHNWWADYIRQRAPRVRFGDVHLFNNYWSSAGNDWSIWAAVGSRVLIENNYFDGVKNPHEQHDPDAQILAIGNYYSTSVTGIVASTGAAFTPPYAYSPRAASDVRAEVMAGAGRQ